MICCVKGEDRKHTSDTYRLGSILSMYDKRNVILVNGSVTNIFLFTFVVITVRGSTFVFGFCFLRYDPLSLSSSIISSIVVQQS